MAGQSLNGLHIAITRPADQAKKLSASISELGGVPFLFPLIAIAPLDDYSTFEKKLDMLVDYDWAIFISSNAVRNAMPRLLARLDSIPRSLKFAAIGPSTAAELAGFGVTDTLTPKSRFDSESLLSMSEMRDVREKRLMIFRGVGGRELLGNTLASRGALVNYAECYQRINPQTSSNALKTMWHNKQLDAIVVTSSEAMRHLLDLVGNEKVDWIKNVTLCVNHDRIAELPKQLGLKVLIAKEPGDDAMLQCLLESLSHE